MPETLKQYFGGINAEVFRPYLKSSQNMPPLKTDKLDLALIEGEERTKMRIPVGGNSSLLLTYRRREGSVASVECRGADLNVVQLQGARQEGFRIDTGLYWVKLFADQILQIATHPDSEIVRVTMPPIIAIQGFVEASEKAIERYREFGSRLGVRYSSQEQLYVRDV